MKSMLKAVTLCTTLLVGGWYMTVMSDTIEMSEVPTPPVMKDPMMDQSMVNDPMPMVASPVQQELVAMPDTPAIEGIVVEEDFRPSLPEVQPTAQEPVMPVVEPAQEAVSAQKIDEHIAQLSDMVTHELSGNLKQALQDKIKKVIQDTKESIVSQ